MMPNQTNPPSDGYTNVRSFTVTVPIEQPPEPVIGPGMILERGRERVVVLRECYKDWTVVKFHRKWARPWPVTGQQLVAETAHIRYLMLAGFRVVREAESKETST